MFNLTKKKPEKKKSEPIFVPVSVHGDVGSEAAGEYYKLVPSSTTWGYIRNWAEKKLIQLRKENDSQGLDDVATAILRGRIAELKAVLALPDKKGLLSDDTIPSTGRLYGEDN